VSGLAAGEGDYSKLPKLLKERFVFLNVYCTNVESEHAPRGPDGPFQFTDRSVPVYVVKKWDGETMVQKLGFSGAAQKEQGMRTLAQVLEKAAKDHGPIVPPKAFRPLTKAYEKAMKSLSGKKPGAAYKDFAKAVTMGADESAFPGGPPAVAKKAQARLDEIDAALEAAIDAALELKVAKAKIELKKVARKYKGVTTLEEKLTEARETMAE